MNKIYFLIIFILSIGIFQLILRPIVFPDLSLGNDYKVYYDVSQHFDDFNYYNYGLFVTTPYYYTPLLLFFFKIFTFFSFSYSYFIWFILNIFFLFVICLFLSIIFKLEYKEYYFILLVGFYPIKRALMLGNIDILILFFIVVQMFLMYTCFRYNHICQYIIYIFFMLEIIIKPFFGLFFVFFLIFYRKYIKIKPLLTIFFVFLFLHILFFKKSYFWFFFVISRYINFRYIISDLKIGSISNMSFQKLIFSFGFNLNFFIIFLFVFIFLIFLFIFLYNNFKNTTKNYFYVNDTVFFFLNSLFFFILFYWFFGSLFWLNYILYLLPIIIYLWLNYKNNKIWVTFFIIILFLFQVHFIFNKIIDIYFLKIFFYFIPIFFLIYIFFSYLLLYFTLDKKNKNIIKNK